ncbi:hypothetical protein UFOVP159_5 [uncultured Caudovirales phage]|uniref:Uncharacterized protein n=1 Tax=uncultured Caudovirales phage TaxID=2100421 RepID=A0A6J7WA02_9CAUD|nr:hypothetical protein UFOVP159_5 [uncultured Caudovirales phage]
MTIYLVCKHQRFRDNYGSGIYKAFIIDDWFYSKDIAQKIVKDLNKRSQKYFYKIKKVGE